MYATVRTYRADPAEMDELLHILDEEFVPQITERPGLCGYQAIDPGDGSLVTVSCFTTREEAEASTELAAQFVRERLADFEIERLDVRSGEVRVNMAAQEILQQAHA
jgi:hypothetical protein